MSVRTHDKATELERLFDRLEAHTPRQQAIVWWTVHLTAAAIGFAAVWLAHPNLWT